MTSPQHDDPFGEATGKILQALAVLTTVGESAARFAAAGAQNRAAKAEQRASLEQAADAARAQADRVAQRAYEAQRRADRQVMDLAFDEAWLGSADILTTANLWRTAGLYATSGDRRAAEAMRRAQQRLASLNPGLIDAYQRHRAAGMSIADAMKAAAQEVWQHQTRPPARPHGNTGDPPAAIMPAPRQLGATPDPHGQQLVDELEAATRAEVARLAADIDPELLSQLQRQWRSAGHAPAADAAALLADTARHIRAKGALGGPIIAMASVRVGRHHDADPDRSPEMLTYDAVEAPVRTGSAMHELAAQHFEHAADAARASQAEGRHLTGQADQQLRRAAADQAQPDLPVTPIDEHRDGQTTGHARRGRAEQDQAAAQRRRFGQTFPPLTTITPIFSHAPKPTTSQPGTTQRRGSTR